MKEKVRKILHENLGIYEPTYKSPFRVIQEEIEKRNLLYEGLLCTYSTDNTLGHLRELGYGDEFCRVGKYNQTETISIFIKPEINEFNEVTREMNICGWFFSGGENKIGKNYKNIDDLLQNSKNNNVWIHFSAKFDKELDLKGTPKTLYHLTPTIRIEKIKEIGLTPKTKSKLANHPDRVYFLTKYDQVDIRNFIRDLFRSETLPYKYKNKYTLISIEQPKLSVRLFRDPDMLNAVYTLENIPPSNIKILKSFNVNGFGEII